MRRRLVSIALVKLYLIGALLTVFVGQAVYRAARDAEDATRTTERTQEALYRLNEAQLSFARLESAQLRYLLWGEEASIRQREAAATAFSEAMRDIGKLVPDDRLQQDRLAKAQALATTRIEMARELAALRARAGFDRPWPAEHSAAAQSIGRQVLQVTEDMRRHEDALLGRKVADQRVQFEHTRRLIMLAGGAALLILLPAYAFAGFQARRRREAEHLMADIVEHLPVAAWRLRSEPGRPRRFVYMRDAVVRDRGFTAESAMRDINVVLASIVDEDRSAVLARMQEAEAAVADFDMTYRVNVPGQPDVRWIRSSARLRQETSGAIIWSGYWHDVTDEVKVRLALESANASLAVVNRELETFSYSVSHDLRAPLAAIDGFGRALWERSHATLDRRGIQLLESHPPWRGANAHIDRGIAVACPGQPRGGAQG